MRGARWNGRGSRPRLTAGVSAGYSTSFAAAQNPISEGGVWFTPPLSPRTAVQTGGGNAYGTMVSFDGTNYNDSAACLTNWAAPDQQVTATLWNNGAVAGLEAELLLRCQFSSTQAFCYELDLIFSGGHASIVRWEMSSGSPNSFTILADSGVNGNIHFTNGAIWVFKATGTVLSAICDSVIVATYDTASDATKYGAGAPGIGFWNETGSAANSPNFGWQDFAAVAL